MEQVSLDLERICSQERQPVYHLWQAIKSEWNNSDTSICTVKAVCKNN